MFRVIQTPWLTSYFRWIYANGFTLPVLIPVFRSFLAKDSLKMIHYSLSAHVLQFVLIFPFYLTIHVNEVWYVLGQPDGMARNLSTADAAVAVVNCFPSMHTSIAFAMLLLAWREKDQLFRWVWTLFCLSIIYSTLYLEIHWVTDVITGIFLALAAVKLGDWIIANARIRVKALTFVGKDFKRTARDRDTTVANSGFNTVMNILFKLLGGNLGRSLVSMLFKKLYMTEIMTLGMWRIASKFRRSFFEDERKEPGSSET